MNRLGWEQRVRKCLSRTLRPVQFWLRRLLLLVIDRFTMLVPVRPGANRVLLVRVDHIGDFVLWLDVALTLAEHYRSQGKQVTLLGNVGWAAWAEELGIFDHVLSLDTERYKRDLRYRVRMAAQLRRLGFGTAVHAATTRVVELGDSLIRVSGAPQKLGPASARGETASDKWYTRLFEVPESGELRKNAVLASGFVGAHYEARVADIRGMVKADRVGPLTKRLPSGPYFVLFPGASHPGRKWPASRFVELAKRIHDHTGWAGIVCGGPGDIPEAAFIASEAGFFLHNLAGGTDLGQLAAVIGGAQLLVSNETSAVHIAAVVDVPSVCILGGGHFGRFVPYDVETPNERRSPRFAVHAMPCFGCNWLCEFHPRRGQPMPCVGNVAVDAVWRELEGLLPDSLKPLSPFGVLPQRGNPTKDEAIAALVGI